MNRLRLITAFALASCAACSSTGGAPHLVPTTPAAASSPSAPLSPQSTANGTLSIVIPPKTTASKHTTSRGRAYVSPSAQALSLTVVNATTGVPAGEQNYPLSATSPGCSSAANGGLSCTLPFTAAPGNDTFTVTLLDGNSEYSAVLAYGTLTQNIVAQGSNAIALTLGGEINTFNATVAQTLVAGVAGTAPIDPAPTDYDGNPIVGTFDAPVTVSLSGDTADFTLSKTTLTQYPDPTLSLIYNGNPKATGVSLTFSVLSPIAGYGTLTQSFPFTVGYTTQQNSGDSLTYTQSTYTSYGGPSPAPASTSSATIAQTVSSGATFNGMSDLLDVHSATSYTSGSSSVEDQYIKYVTSGPSTALNYYGGVFTQGTETSVDQYVQPLVTNVLPENTATQLNYDIGLTQTYTDTQSFEPQQETEQLNADGSYTLKSAFQIPSQSYTFNETTTANANGTATDTIDQTGANEQVTTYGLPAVSNGTYTIPVTISGGNDSSQPPAPATTVNVPDWIPGNAGFPQLFTYPASVSASMIPPICGPSSGMVATDVSSTLQEIDPLGAVQYEKFDYYNVQGIGTVCSLDDFVVDQYDATNTGSLVREESSSTTTSLTSETLESMLRHPKTASRQALPGIHDAGAAFAHARAVALRLRAISAARARRAR